MRACKKDRATALWGAGAWPSQAIAGTSFPPPVGCSQEGVIPDRRWRKPSQGKGIHRAALDCGSPSRSCGPPGMTCDGTAKCHSAGPSDRTGEGRGYTFCHPPRSSRGRAAEPGIHTRRRFRTTRRGCRALLPPVVLMDPRLRGEGRSGRHDRRAQRGSGCAITRNLDRPYPHLFPRTRLYSVRKRCAIRSAYLRSPLVRRILTKFRLRTVRWFVILILSPLSRSMRVNGASRKCLRRFRRHDRLISGSRELRSAVIGT